MKLDMEDGRVIDLPDECSDEFARQLKRLILTTEGRASAAEQRVEQVRAEMAALIAKPQHDEELRAQVAALAEAVRSLTACTQHGLAAVVAAARADRHLVEDDYGRPFSRVK